MRKTRTGTLMKKHTFAIEKDDLSVYKTAELKRMLNFVDFAGELVAEVNGWCDGETLPDLEEAMITWLSAMGDTLIRIGRRLGGEVAKREVDADSKTTPNS
jgi:hypothetical protein